MNKLLCAITLLAGSSGVAAAQAVDKLLPEDTLLVFSVDDAAACSKAMEDMPTSKIMREEEVVGFLEQPMAALEEAIAGLEQKLKAEEGFEDLSLSLEDLMAGSYGRVFFAMTHIALPDPQSGRDYPDIGLVIGWEGKDGAPDWQALVKDLIGRAAGRSGQELSFQAVTRGAHTYEELVGGDEERPPILFGKAGDLQLFSLSHQSLGAVLARANGAEQGSLATSATYASAQKNLAVDGADTTRIYIAVDQGLRAVAEVVKLVMAMENETEFIPLVDRILDMSGLMAVKSVAVAGQSAGGVAHSRAFVGIEGERKGLLAMTPDKPIGLDRLNTIPKAVSSFSVGQFEPAKLYDFVMDVIREVDEDVYNEANENIAGLGAMVGGDQPISLRDDILANIGPEFMFVQPQSSNAMMPAFLIMAEVADGPKLMSTIQSIIDFAGSQSGGEISARMSNYKGSDILQLNLPSDIPIPLSPSMTVRDGQFLMALTLGDLKRHVRFVDRGGANITENEDFQRFYGKIPENAALSGLSYTDVKGQVEMYYGQAVTMLPMVTMMAETELPIDFAMMPTSDTLTQHLYGSLSYTMSTENGIITEGFSPIGGEAIAAVAAAAAAGGAMFGMTTARQMEPAMQAEFADEPMPVDDGPEDAVRRDLSNLKAGVTIYKLQNDNVYPDRLEQLLVPTADYEDGCLGQSSLPIDPWGNGYHYERTSTGYMIWSSGPNGQNERGEGDDIVKRK